MPGGGPSAAIITSPVSPSRSGADILSRNPTTSIQNLVVRKIFRSVSMVRDGTECERAHASVNLLMSQSRGLGASRWLRLSRLAFRGEDPAHESASRAHPQRQATQDVHDADRKAGG